MISILHATRKRPEMAIATCKRFLSTALDPLNIEYIFAIDADDEESKEKLGAFQKQCVERKEYYINCGIVPEPNGCVKAWNGAAQFAVGDILIQVSDDWIPPKNWDYLIKQKLDITKPQCLHVSDGHRTDQLMCMAILTRERYLRQHDKDENYLFHPDYFGVFSDTEYSLRAYHDGVVVDGRDIIFEHMHPVWNKGEWDETYERQNDSERYKEGREIFIRRNQHILNEKVDSEKTETTSQ
jgi:hypothetical protein